MDRPSPGVSIWKLQHGDFHPRQPGLVNQQSNIHSIRPKLLIQLLDNDDLFALLAASSSRTDPHSPPQCRGPPSAGLACPDQTLDRQQVASSSRSKDTVHLVTTTLEHSKAHHMADRAAVTPSSLGRRACRDRTRSLPEEAPAAADRFPCELKRPRTSRSSPDSSTVTCEYHIPP